MQEKSPAAPDRRTDFTSGSSSGTSRAMTRRRLLQGSVAGAGGVLAGMACRDLSAATEKNRPGMIRLHDVPFAHKISEEMWANLEGQRFHVREFSFLTEQTEKFRTQLELVEVQEIKYSGDLDRHRDLRPGAISLIFRRLSGKQLESASYSIFHKGLGQFDLFVNPLQLERYAKQDVYEAVLN